MKYRMLSFSFIILFALSYNSVRAQESEYPCCESHSSILSYGVRGLFTGALFGLSTAYLVKRDNGIHGDDWKTLLFGSGAGLLSGAAVGVGLGFWDNEDGRYRYGQYILRDMLYGGGFCALLGAAAGGLTVIKTEKGEHVLFGTAIGFIAGVGIGSVIGVFEGHSHTDRAFRKRHKSIKPRPITTTVIVAQGQDGRIAWGPGVVGVF